MKKAPKSLQAWLVTLFVGGFLPKLLDLNQNTFINKIIWRGLLTVAFNLATIIVGGLYGAKLLNGKQAGGKARIAICLIVIAILLCVTTSVLAFMAKLERFVFIALGVVAAIFIGILILNCIFAIKERKRQFEASQKRSVGQKTRYARTMPTTQKTMNNQKLLQEESGTPKANTAIDNSPSEGGGQSEDETTISLKTIYQLWEERDKSEKCLTITNDDNPDLKWVKIYKPPYGDGKFYGYIKMMNAHDTVNGEIYFADEPIWEVYRG